jgi:predicted ester cyclase
MTTLSVISRDEVGEQQASNLALVRELVDRDDAPAVEQGNYTAELDRLRDAFSELTQDILFMVADGETVMTRFHMTGALPDNGPALTASGLMVHRVVDGRVVEAWIDYDRAGVAHDGGAGVSDGRQVGRRSPVGKRGNGHAHSKPDLDEPAPGGGRRLSEGDQ